MSLPLIDISGPVREWAPAIALACRENGFFYVTGHKVPPALLASLDRASREFFALPTADKMAFSMAHGGKAWRGYFPIGDELTSGRPDLKEGLYFGTDLPAGHPLPLHGPNLYPPMLSTIVPGYLEKLTQVAQRVMTGVAVSLDLPSDYFSSGYTADPTILFRIFHYPPSTPDDSSWGVGEHTDYGLLTLLAQDSNGGLQVRSPSGWVDAPPLPGAFVCNIGDMLDRLTGGYYRSTPHRVRNLSGNERLSFPFFFDPAFAAEVPPLPGLGDSPGRARWDGLDLQAFTGTYGDYLVAKVSRVFPLLGRLP